MVRGVYLDSLEELVDSRGPGVYIALIRPSRKIQERQENGSSGLYVPRVGVEVV